MTPWSPSPLSITRPLHPQRILRECPARSAQTFLLPTAKPWMVHKILPDGNLRRVLRLWSGMAIAADRPGFYEAQEAALTGTGGGMLLEDYIQMRRTQA